MNVPAAARAHTEEGAKAFAELYTTEMDRATVTTDSNTLKALSAPSCAACQGVIEIVDGYRSRGERQEQQSVRIDLAQARSYTAKRAVVDVLAVDQAHRVIAKDGKIVSTSKGAKINFRHTLAWTRTGWLVADSEIQQ